MSEASESEEFIVDINPNLDAYLDALDAYIDARTAGQDSAELRLQLRQAYADSAYSIAGLLVKRVLKNVTPPNS